MGTAAPLRIPLLRFGRVYDSLEFAPIRDHRTGEVVGELGLANAGLIRLDAKKAPAARAALRSLPIAKLLERCRVAAKLFAEADLPLVPGRDATVSYSRYVELVSATTGLPRTLVVRNVAKMAGVLAQMDDVLKGLTRGLPYEAIERGVGTQDGVTVSVRAMTDALAVQLPNNSPGVNSLWLPALALQVPVVLKPGTQEPWSPLRLVSALVTAGLPAEAFAYYGADHANGDAVVESHGRAIVFGNDRTVARYANDPRVEVHGTGFSKVVLGPDVVDHPEKWLDATVRSILDNGGRSCVNASAVVVPFGADRVARLLAERLDSVKPRASDDPDAQLSAFADANVAAALDRTIDAALATPGATDVSASVRNAPRLVTRDGATYLLPTIVRATPDHPLAKKEVLFPFAAVIEQPLASLAESLGPSLVVSAITDDAALIDRLLASRDVERLNIGSIPTTAIRWDQPHEGNLFEFLYARRAFARSAS